MNLSHLLNARRAAGKPVRVALIGAGKFGSMFLSQVPHTPGLEVPVIVDLVATHGYVSFLGRVSALPIADKVRIVDLDVHLPMSYHVAFNHRKAAADACAVIIEAAARITSEPVAQTERVRESAA